MSNISLRLSGFDELGKRLAGAPSRIVAVGPELLKHIENILASV